MPGAQISVAATWGGGYLSTTGSGGKWSLHSWSPGTVKISVTQKGAHTPIFAADARVHISITWLWQAVALTLVGLTQPREK